MAVNAKRTESPVRELLIELGENPERKGCSGRATRRRRIAVPDFRQWYKSGRWVKLRAL